MGYALGKEGRSHASEGALSGNSSCPIINPPHLSSCHQCRLPLVTRLQTFYSQWRIVLLCRECFARIRSGQTCSYCFSVFTEQENAFLDCNECSRRVHRACIPLHHRNLSPLQISAVKFICIDCCPIPKLRGEDPKTSGCSTSRTAVTVPLEDLIKGAKSISLKKISSKNRVSCNAMKMVMVSSGFPDLESRGISAVQLVKDPSLKEMGGSSKFPGSTDDGNNTGNATLQFHSSNTWLNNAMPLSKHRLCGCDGEGASKLHQKDIEATNLERYTKIYFRKRTSSGRFIKGGSQPIINSCPLYEKENGDLMKKTSVFISDSLRDCTLQEKIFQRFPDSIDDGSNVASSMLNSIMPNSTWSNNTLPLVKFRFCDDDDGDRSSKIQQGSIHARGSNRILKKYFRKRWGSGEIMRANSQSVLTNGMFLMQKNGDLMKQNKGCNTASLRDSSLKESASSLKFPDSTDDDSNASSALLPLYNLNTQPMKKYFRKHCGTGRIMQRRSQSNLTSCPLFKQENEDPMKKMSGFKTGWPVDLSLNEKVSPLKSVDSSCNGCNTGSALLPHHIFSTLENSTLPLTKSRFGGNGERRSIDLIVCRPMKKYFRRRRYSQRTEQVNSLSVLTDMSLFKKKNDGLMKQIRGCDTGCSENFFFNEKVRPLNFPPPTNVESGIGSALPCHGRSTLLCNTMPLTKYTFGGLGGYGDRERSSKVQLKRIDAIDPGRSMKKYYRKNFGSRRTMQGNSQSISADGPLFKHENGSQMIQDKKCSTGCTGPFAMEEKMISLEFSDSTDDSSNGRSSLLQFVS